MASQHPTRFEQITLFFQSLWSGFRSAPLYLKLFLINGLLGGPLLVLSPVIPIFRSIDETSNQRHPGFLSVALGVVILVLSCGFALRKKWSRILAITLLCVTLGFSWSGFKDFGAMFLLITAVNLLFAYWYLFKKKSVVEFFNE